MKKKLILIGIAILVVLLTTWTIWGNVTVGITHYTVLSEKIPAAFNHYRISVVSDLHNAHFGKNNGNIVSLIEKQKPDMIAITGDLVDSSKTNIEIAESLIQRLVMENEAVPQEQMERRVTETAKALHIENLLGRNIFALSGGEKQKIAFASVYAMNPEVYLLDEPSSNLDMTAIGELRDHLQLIKSQGKTVIIAEHRLYYLTNVADRIIYLENGRIAGDFTPEQFRMLSAEERQSMGLRATDLREGKPVCAVVASRSPVLELQNASLAYKKQPVLSNVSLQAASGDIIAVVGHNGAGKTTFSRALCGLHKEASGSYLWNGRPQKPKERMKRSYMVMQDVNYQLFAESVEAECIFGIKNPDTKLAEQTLQELGLALFRERHPNTLSGGQKQRLAAASSMICGKELLVFDEPTSGLDYDSMVRLSALIRRLSDIGKVIFIVTHDYEFVCRTCTRVLHLDGGEIRDDFSITEALLQTVKKIFDVR